MSDSGIGGETSNDNLTAVRLYKFTLRDGSVHNRFVTEDVPLTEWMEILNASAAEPADLEKLFER